MNVARNVEEVKAKLEIAPLIDVVFLLLIYFMVTASLIKKEGDVAFMLPSGGGGTPDVMPVEAIIEISSRGIVQLEGVSYPDEDGVLADLSVQLEGLKSMAESQDSPLYINIVPNADAEHYRIIDVMDACTAAGVSNLSFSAAPE